MSTSTEYAQESGRAAWSGKLAFVLSAAASAVGLGAMWRFPYLAAKYGGGMFLLVYLVLVFTIGISLLLLENALGRKTGQSAIGAYKAFGKKYSFIGILMSAVPFIILPYYCVIGGWVTKYLAAYAGGSAGALTDGGTYFTNFIGNGPESILFMVIFTAIMYFIVGLGVNNGLEKANFIMMPALIVVAVIIAIYALTMPGAIDGLAFYLIPDFSKFSPELVIAALGQTFFTLSLAMGIMVTYGSYLDKTTKLTSSAGQIAGSTFAVSLLAGFMIIPAAFVAMGSGDAVAQNSGPSLMFGLRYSRAWATLLLLWVRASLSWCCSRRLPVLFPLQKRAPLSSRTLPTARVRRPSLWLPFGEPLWVSSFRWVTAPFRSSSRWAKERPSSTSWTSFPIRS